MQCPNCDEKMGAVSSSNVTAHKCFFCEGTWLSDEAFRAIKMAPGYREAMECILENSSEIGEKPSTRKCPECPVTNLRVTYNEKLELDRCPSCAGVFFDKGELRGENAPSRENQNEGAASYLVMEGACWAVIALFGN